MLCKVFFHFHWDLYYLWIWYIRCSCTWLHARGSCRWFLPEGNVLFAGLRFYQQLFLVSYFGISGEGLFHKGVVEETSTLKIFFFAGLYFWTSHRGQDNLYGTLNINVYDIVVFGEMQFSTLIFLRFIWCFL